MSHIRIGQRPIAGSAKNYFIPANESKMLIKPKRELINMASLKNLKVNATVPN